MTYLIETAPAAVRQLRTLDHTSRRRVQAVIELLADHPRPSGAKKLVGGAGEWRVRSGDFRVVYEIRDDVLLILVVAARHRRQIYQRRRRPSYRQPAGAWAVWAGAEWRAFRSLPRISRCSLLRGFGLSRQRWRC